MSVGEIFIFCIPKRQIDFCLQKDYIRQGPDASRNQHADLYARTEGSDRAHHAGQDTQTPSRGHPGLLRSSPHQQRSYRSDQRPPRTPTRIRTRIPQPHQLHHPSTPRNRRIQTPTTPPIMKSHQMLMLAERRLKLLAAWRGGHRRVVVSLGCGSRSAA